jgi:hypothetical protein
MIPCDFFNQTGADGRIVIVYKDLFLFGNLFDEFLALNSRPVFLIVQVCKLMGQVSLAYFFTAQQANFIVKLVLLIWMASFTSISLI